MAVAAPLVRPVHLLPGRVRLHVPAVRRDAPLAARLQAAALATPGVHQARVNRAAGALVLAGEPAAIAALVRDGAVARWLRAAEPPARPTPAPAPRTPLAPLALTAAAFALSHFGGWPATMLAVGCAAAGLLPHLQASGRLLVRERRLGAPHLELAALLVMLLRRDVRGLAATSLLSALADQIRDRTARRSRAVVARLEPPRVESVRVRRRGVEHVLPAARVRVGDRVVVAAGTWIPVDGEVVAGQGWVDQQVLTGERRLVPRRPGDAVFAGTWLVAGALEIRATAVGSRTRAARIARALQQAPPRDSRVADYASALAERLVGPVFLLAAGSYALSRDGNRAAAILNVDVTAGLELSAPTAILATMTRASHLGVLFKSGRAVEQLAVVSAMVFDKTGTLTTGVPVVERAVSLDARFAPAAIAALAAAAEAGLRHRVARAIWRYARQHRASVPAPAAARHLALGGVTAVVEGHTVHVGTREFLRAAGVALPRQVPELAALGAAGYALSYVALDGTLVGALAYRDPPRPEAARLVHWLRAHGVAALHLATGDDEATALAVARAVGIPQVHARLLADDKAAVVRALQRRGHVVAFVGDDLDDRLAMQTADVSVALRHGAAATRELAEVELLHSHLLGIRRAIELARGARRIIQQNAALVSATAVASLLLATSGALGPVGVRVVADASTLGAAANSLRPLLGPARRHRLDGLPCPEARP
jgi:Cu2+-exporting ATPase